MDARNYSVPGDELGPRPVCRPPQHQSGLAAGVNDTFRQAGIAVGVAALGALIPTGALAHGDVTAYVNGLHDALVVAGALAGAGALAAAWMIGRPQFRAARERRVEAVLLEPAADCA